MLDRTFEVAAACEVESEGDVDVADEVGGEHEGAVHGDDDVDELFARKVGVDLFGEVFDAFLDGFVAVKLLHGVLSHCLNFVHHSG